MSIRTVFARRNRRRSTRRRLWALITAFVAVAPSAFAQAPPDSAVCRQRLTAPSADSNVVQLSLIVAPFDATQRVSPDDESLLGEGVRQMLALPRVVQLDVYDAQVGVLSYPTVSGVYRVTWRRDGHFANARVVGGTRNAPMDRAILAAIAALDTSQLMPPPDSTALAGADSVELRIVLTPEAVWSAQHPRGPLPPEPGLTRLVTLRVPTRGVTRALNVVPPVPAPVYPPELRKAGVQGEVDVQFVVDAAGILDPQTVQVVRADAVEFVEPALAALRAYRFEPLMVEGCAVAAIVQTPFVFRLP